MYLVQKAEIGASVVAAAGLQRRRDLRLEEEWKRGKRELEPSLYKMENGFISNGDGFFFFFKMNYSDVMCGKSLAPNVGT